MEQNENYDCNVYGPEVKLLISYENVFKLSVIINMQWKML